MPKTPVEEYLLESCDRGWIMAGDLEELKLHQETIGSTENSPLQLIREKEMEISGRMLASKREADEIVADARRKAAEIISAAEHEGGSGAKDREQQIMAEAQAEADRLRSEAEAQAGSMSASIDARSSDAVGLVVEAVTRI